jgi:hypothetical protein
MGFDFYPQNGRINVEKIAKEEAEKARDSFVEILAEAEPEINGDGDAATKLKQLRAQGRQRRTATCIKSVREKIGGSGVSSVSYRLDDGAITKKTDRSSMEPFFIKLNEVKIQQAQDTPFMVHSMASEVVWLGIGPTVRQILDVTYEPPERG